MVEITVLFYNEDLSDLSSQIQAVPLTLPGDTAGRVRLPADFRKGKSIVAVIEGHVNVISRFGDRWGTQEQMAQAEQKACA